MAKIMALPPIPGVRDLQTLMAFIMNKEEYDARLEALVALQEEIHTLIGKAGKAQDLDALLSSAMRKDAEASTTLESARMKAKQEAMDILQAAKVEAEDKKREAERIYQETVAKMSQLVTAKEEFEAYQATTEADIDQRLKACAAQEVSTAKAKAEVEAMHEMYTAKLAKLKAATEGV